MIQDSRDPKDYKRYEYYKIATGPSNLDTPYRLAVNHRGIALEADTIDANGARLIECHGVLGEIGESPYSTEIEEVEFWDLCQRHVEGAKKKPAHEIVSQGIEPK